MLHEVRPDVPRIGLTATATGTHAEITTRLKLDRRPAFRGELRADRRSGTASSRRLSRANSCSNCCAPRTRATPGSPTAFHGRPSTSTTEFLVQNGIAALPYHAGLDSRTRGDERNALPARGRLGRWCATIAFGMGIEKP